MYLSHFSANDIISAMKFGCFGREDSALAMITINGGLTGNSSNKLKNKTENTFCLIGCTILTPTYLHNDFLSAIYIRKVARQYGISVELKKNYPGDLGHFILFLGIKLFLFVKMI